MRAIDYISTAQTNLARTKLRTFLTVLAFLIGTFTLSMTTAFSQGLHSYINTQIGAYGVPNMVEVGLASTTQQSSSSGVAYYSQGRQTADVGGKGGDKAVYTLNAQDLAKVKATTDIKAAYASYSTLNVDYITYGN